MRTHHVQVHLFDGYWEDIGTIKSFYEANLDLASREPQFDMAVADAPIYTHPRFLPPSRIDGAEVRRSLVADGCKIEEGAVIENSIIGLRCLIGRNVDDPQFDPHGQRLLRVARRNRGRQDNGRPPLGVGAARISKARSSTRTAASAATYAGQLPRPREHRGDRLRHDPRRHRRNAQGDRAAGQLVAESRDEGKRGWTEIDPCFVPFVE